VAHLTAAIALANVARAVTSASPAPSAPGPATAAVSTSAPTRERRERAAKDMVLVSQLLHAQFELVRRLRVARYLCRLL
jgi:hypothetical protein